MERLHTIAELLAATFRTGRKVMICGNGGSSCDAAHFAEELTGRFRAPTPARPDRPPLPAMACTDPGHITCTANDYGFEHVFARWVGAFGHPGDCLIVLSTSGNSDNILRAIDAAKVIGMTTIALLGKTGGPALPRADHAVIVPGRTSDRIQELHMLILHAFVEHVEDALYPER
ncbi:MAG: SIS domain-containing protein [Phycisphaerales bacterium]|nr:SIS domain-containing protein [Phycisphaerales bacterium]